MEGKKLVRGDRVKLCVDLSFPAEMSPAGGVPPKKELRLKSGIEGTVILQMENMSDPIVAVTFQGHGRNDFHVYRSQIHQI